MSALANIEQDSQKLDHFQALLEFKHYKIPVRQENCLEVQKMISFTKICLEDLQCQLAKYKLPEPSIWAGKEVRVLHCDSINLMTVGSSAYKVEEIRCRADEVFKQFRDNISEFLVLPSSGGFAPMYLDFSEVMQKLAAFDRSYGSSIHEHAILVEEQIKAYRVYGAIISSQEDSQS